MHNKILIVDDDPDICTILENLIDDVALTKSVNNGIGSIKTAKEFFPDIVIMDIYMPDMNGFEAAQKIKKIPELKYVKILFISGFSDQERRLQCYANGADDFISKPFDENEIKAKIAVFLKLKNIEEINDINYKTWSIFSHASRTPINGILGPLSIIRETCLDKNKELVEMAYKSAEKLTLFINDISLFSKLKSNPILNYSNKKLYDKINKIIDHERRIINTKNLTPRISVDMNISIKADWNYFEQALHFTIHNAVKYSNSNNKLEITAKRVEKYISISIRDFGKGIHPSKLSLLFNPLHKFNVQNHAQGYSLKMPIVKEIMKVHGGSIKINTDVETGTEIILLIPYKKQKKANNK